jgi:urease accessory protein
LPPDGSGTAEGETSRGLVSGRLELAFAVGGDGRTYVRRQYAGYPFHVCRALYQDPEHPGLATLYVQSCSGGIYENDRLDLTFANGASAEAHVSTQSATVVHSMTSGSAAQRARIECEAGSYLEYLPDAQILFPGSRFRSEVAIRLSGNALAVVADSFLVHDPEGQGGVFSAYFSEIVVENEAGTSLAVDRLRIDGAAFAESCPGLSGCYAAQGTMIVAGFDLPAKTVVAELRRISLDRQIAVLGFSQLPNNAGLLVRVLAADGAALKLALYRAWCAARRALKGSCPQERRK